MDRQSGVLLPVFSLPGQYGCGTFGKQAFRWLDKVKQCGFSIWQVLPFGITDDQNSPYMSFSSFAGNPYFIDPEILFEKGLVTEGELAEQKVDYPYLCRYSFLKEKRVPFLIKASKRYENYNEVMDFMKAHPLIDGTCLFLALKDKNGGKPWQEWTDKCPDPDVLYGWRFIQFEFHRQWKKVSDYAHSLGIRIMGDLPFYVSQDSYDVWSSPEEFKLDERNNPSVVAGVPPDYFNENGQLWGNPIYDWDEMAKDGFSWWKDRLGYALSLFDGIRLDHFRAISEFWEIPAGSATAKSGKWVKGPGKALIDAFRELENGKLILAEDLGVIDESTRELLRYSGYPGMAVLQFGFGDDPDSPHLPHNYRENLAAYSGTHDNNTLLGFWASVGDDVRREALDYLGYPADPFDASMRALMRSSAGIVILPLQDLLGFGSDTRVNTPGVSDGNWQYRVEKSQMESLDTGRFAHMNRIYSRIPKKATAEEKE